MIRKKKKIYKIIITIVLTGKILKKRSELKDRYSSVVIPFLNRIFSQDSSVGGISSFYPQIHNYILYQDFTINKSSRKKKILDEEREEDEKEEEGEEKEEEEKEGEEKEGEEKEEDEEEEDNFTNQESNFFDLVLPNNPMYSTIIKDDYESVYFDDLNLFVNPSEKIDPINTIVPSDSLKLVINLIFKKESNLNLTLGLVNQKLSQAILSRNYSSEILKLGFMEKFFDIFIQIKPSTNVGSQISQLIKECNTLCNFYISKEK